MPRTPKRATEFELGTYVSLALSYVGVFGHLGIVMPGMALWIDGRGYGTGVIGVVLAIPALSKMAAPWTWGRWADRIGSLRGWIALAAVPAVVAIACFPFEVSLATLLALTVVYGFCRAPVLPLLEATTLRAAAGRRVRYGPVRLWGSLAFAVGSLLFGHLWSLGRGDDGLRAAAAFLALAAVAAPRLSSTSVAPAPDAPGAGWPRGRLVAFLAACALMQASHAAYYGFYSLHVARLGYDGHWVGLLWALAIVAEVAVLFRLDRWVDRIGSVAVMRAALVVAAGRWVWIGTATETWELVAAQLLHAATYAAFHVAAIRHIDRGLGASRRTRAQTLYSGFSFGLGLSVGSVVVGQAAETWGLPPLFVASGVVALAAVPLVGLGRLHASGVSGDRAPRDDDAHR